MTIFLPDQIDLFKEAFQSAYSRIITCEHDELFYQLYVELIKSLRSNSLVGSYILELEEAIKIKSQKFSLATLEALEDSWMRLWKYHSHSLKQRKKLVSIKRVITFPNEITYSPLYNRILFKMFEFRYFSPFCRIINTTTRLFRDVQSELHFVSTRFNHFHTSTKSFFLLRKVVQYKINKKDKQQCLLKNIFDLGFDIITIPFNRIAEKLPIALFSPKIDEIENRFFISGQNSNEKRQNIQTIAEYNPVFCWERLRFLQDCFISNGSTPKQKPSFGRWFMIRNIAWQSALERCEKEVLLGAKMSLNQKSSSNPSSSIDVFLMCEHQIHRKDFEGHLRSLQNHIYTHLLKIQNMQIMLKTQLASSTSPTLERLTKADSNRIKREDFIIDHTKKYKIDFPCDSVINRFNDYKKKCPNYLSYGLTKWKEIIKKHCLN